MMLIEKLKNWRQGRYVPPPPNDPDCGLVFISPGHYEQPLLAKMLEAIGRFWLAHWQWIVGTILAIIGIIVSAVSGGIL